MKNKLSDLNNYLFAQLERLSDESLTPEQIEHEATRSEAIVSLSDQVLKMASLQIQAAKIAQDAGSSPVPYLPAPSNGEPAAVAAIKPVPVKAVSAPAPARKLAAFPPFRGSEA